MASTGDTCGVLIFDGDCGFCSTTARWLVSRGTATAVPWQSLPLTPGDVARAQIEAGWMCDGRITSWGSEAIAAALRARGGLARPVGSLLALPGVRAVASLVYRKVAVNRQRMPGGTATCALPTERRGQGVRFPVFAFAGVLLIFLLQFVLWAETGREPYPAILMPTFAGVPDQGGMIRSGEARMTAVYADGTSERITAGELLPYTAVSSVFVINAIFADSQTANEPETAAWLRQRLLRHAPGSDPVAMRVRWVVTWVNARTKEKTDGPTTSDFTVNLRAAS